MEHSYETLLVKRHQNHLLCITMNRPEVANAFNTRMAEELIQIFEALAISHQGVRCIIFTGSGQRAFCAGGDLKERNGMTDEVWQAQHVIYERMIRAVIECPIPIIGAVNGAAYGGGCELAAAVDFCYVSESAKFAQTEVTLGIIPGAGGTQNLARAIGERRAKELILSGCVFNAQQAFDWGLANAIYKSEELMGHAFATAEKIALNAPIAVRQAKQAIHKGLQMSLLDGLAFEIEAYNRTVPTDDRKEGIAAFNEKRQPLFQGK